MSHTVLFWEPNDSNASYGNLIKLFKSKIEKKIFLSIQVFHMMLTLKYFLEINCGKDVKKDF